MSRIFIRNIPAKYSVSDLESLFSKCGKVEEIILKNNYAFIQYPSYKNSEEAIQKFNNTYLSGNLIVVEFAKTKTEKMYDRKKEKCFKCEGIGHWAKDCPNEHNNSNHLNIKKDNQKINKKFKNIRKSPNRSFEDDKISYLNRSRSSSNVDE